MGVIKQMHINSFAHLTETDTHESLMGKQSLIHTKKLFKQAFFLFNLVTFSQGRIVGGQDKTGW